MVESEPEPSSPPPKCPACRRVGVPLDSVIENPRFDQYGDGLEPLDIKVCDRCWVNQKTRALSDKLDGAVERLGAAQAQSRRLDHAVRRLTYLLIDAPHDPTNSAMVIMKTAVAGMEKDLAVVA